MDRTMEIITLQNDILLQQKFYMDALCRQREARFDSEKDFYGMLCEQFELVINTKETLVKVLRSEA